jgi:hypothetical protein
MNSFRAAGVSAILDWAEEEDLLAFARPTPALSRKPVVSSGSGSGSADEADAAVASLLKASSGDAVASLDDTAALRSGSRDSLKGSTSAASAPVSAVTPLGGESILTSGVTTRVYSHASEEDCDKHLAAYINAVDTAATLPSQGFAAIKLTAGEASGRLFRWVAFFTGSKNAMKGAGFFLGGLLLDLLGFRAALWAMAAALLLVLAGVVLALPPLMLQTHSTPVLRALLQAGDAVALLSPWQVHGELAAGRLLALPVPLQLLGRRLASRSVPAARLAQLLRSVHARLHVLSAIARCMECTHTALQAHKVGSSTPYIIHTYMHAYMYMYMHTLRCHSNHTDAGEPPLS